MTTAITKVALQAEDTAAAALFYKALGVDGYVEVVPVTEDSSGFRGYALSIICSQPANVDAFVAAALGAGAEELKPASKSFWGYGGAVRAPDGSVWTIAASSKLSDGMAMRSAVSWSRSAVGASVVDTAQSLHRPDARTHRLTEAPDPEVGAVSAPARAAVPSEAACREPAAARRAVAGSTAQEGLLAQVRAAGAVCRLPEPAAGHRHLLAAEPSAHPGRPRAAAAPPAPSSTSSA